MLTGVLILSTPKVTTFKAVDVELRKKSRDNLEPPVADARRAGVDLGAIR
jgi:hypothetical protein